MNVLVTGAAGFIGKNLLMALNQEQNYKVWKYTLDSQPSDLKTGLQAADVIFHLAGANRPTDPAEFEETNVNLTAEICRILGSLNRKPLLVFASSIQAELDNPYGKSKRRAEEELRRFAEATATPVVTFRLQNVFGKWCRPNYNSVVATFCHNIARDLPITITDPNREMDLVYIDDVVAAFLSELDRQHTPAFTFANVPNSYCITVGALAETIRSFRQMRVGKTIPDFARPITRYLYATYLSNLDEADFAYGLEVRADSRGELAEFLKAGHFGQVFVSTTRPGVTRGNHFHHTKTEKFLVVQGRAEILFRHVLSGERIVYQVAGSQLRVVDIPPGYTHAIKNVGEDDLIVLFWASEVFNPGMPDTYALEV